MLNVVGFSVFLKNYIFTYMPSTYSLRASNLLRRSTALGAGWDPPRDLHSIYRRMPLRTFPVTHHFPQTCVYVPDTRKKDIRYACNALLGRATLYCRHGGRSSYCRAPNGRPGARQYLGGNLVPNHFWPIDIGLTGSLRLFCTGPISVGTASDLSLVEDQVANSAVASEKKSPHDRTLKLLSGSCYLPHPDKEATGGEDAHFICIEEQAIGVADGVGGWADQGIDAGKYARQLMSNAVTAIREHMTGSIDPAKVLEKAYFKTKEKGSSTACIIVLTDQGVHAVNIGDSGFIVVREGSIISRSPVQQHEFNMPYQLDSGGIGDLPSAAQVFSFPVAPGDVIVVGTDGLFDNLYTNEVATIVVQATRTKLDPQVAAQKIAELARQRALDNVRQTPFSTSARHAGYRYYGGKLDDISVVVSYVSANSAHK